MVCVDTISNLKDEYFIENTEHRIVDSMGQSHSWRPRIPKEPPTTFLQYAIRLENFPKCFCVLAALFSLDYKANKLFQQKRHRISRSASILSRESGFFAKIMSAFSRSKHERVVHKRQQIADKATYMISAAITALQYTLKDCAAYATGLHQPVMMHFDAIFNMHATLISRWP